MTKTPRDPQEPDDLPRSYMVVVVLFLSSFPNFAVPYMERVLFGWDSAVAAKVALGYLALDQVVTEVALWRRRLAEPARIKMAGLIGAMLCAAAGAWAERSGWLNFLACLSIVFLGWRWFREIRRLIERAALPKAIKSPDAERRAWAAERLKSHLEGDEYALKFGFTRTGPSDLEGLAAETLRKEDPQAK